MRKFTTSKSHRIVCIGDILICFTGSACFILLFIVYLKQEKLNPSDDPHFLSLTVLICGLGIYAIISLLYWYLTDPILGEIIFDNIGITFFAPLKTFKFKYNECADIGFTSKYGIGRRKKEFYVYLSKVEILPEQRRFLAARRSKKKKGKRNMPLYQSEFLMFQYTSEIFSEFIECVPSPFREELLKKERELGLKCIE